MQQLNGINAHMAEIRNSAVKRLKAMLSYMNKDNFRPHLKLYLWFKNSLLKGKQADEYRGQPPCIPSFDNSHRFRAEGDLDDDGVNYKRKVNANFIISCYVLFI